MNKQKEKGISTLVGIIIIVVAIAVLFGGVFAYVSWQKNRTTPNDAWLPVKQKESINNQTAGWKTYINTQYGFEFKYPEDFVTYNAISNPSIKDIISFKDNKSLSCGIWSFPADDRDYSREKLTSNKEYERLEVNNAEIFKSAIKGKLGGGRGLQMFLFSKNGEEFNLACHISDNAFDEGLSAFNQILSTFKFTTPTSQTAGWKTYINNDLGYEIKYPSNWIFYDGTDSYPIINFCGINYTTKDQCRMAGKNSTPVISLRNDSLDITAPNFCVNYPDNIFCLQNLILSKSNININGKTGTIIEFKDSSIHALWKLNSQNKNMFELQVLGLKTAPDYRNIFNQMLSTFKFTTPTDQTAGWKIYANSEYGFEFKYPLAFFYWDPKALIGDCNYNVFPAQCPNINDIVANEQIAEGGDAVAVRNNISFFPKGEKATISNTNYCLYKTGDPAAGSVYYDYYYATVKNQKCFIIRLVTRLANCGVFGTAGDKAYDDCIIYNATTYPQKLNQIISTFKFIE